MANMSIWNHAPYELEYQLPSAQAWLVLPIGETIIARHNKISIRGTFGYVVSTVVHPA